MVTTWLIRPQIRSFGLSRPMKTEGFLVDEGWWIGLSFFRLPAASAGDSLGHWAGEVKGCTRDLVPPAN